MGSVNKVILLGNLGKDPEIKSLESGVTVANFTLATSETFRDKENNTKREHTEWHNIVAWRGVAESVEKSEIKKGDRVYMEGKIRGKKWTDKDGNNRYSLEIVMDSFTVLNRVKDKTNSTVSAEEESSGSE